MFGTPEVTFSFVEWKVAMDFVLFFCCHSCLKGDDDRELYKILELTSKNPSTDDVKRAYKKASLAIHPGGQQSYES